MKLKEYWLRVPKFLKNKYMVTALAFFLWVLIFDQNDLISQIQLQIEINQLQEDKEYFEKEIIKTSESLEELMSDNRKLEKFAREKYYMRKPNEELFVIVQE